MEPLDHSSEDTPRDIPPTLEPDTIEHTATSTQSALTRPRSHRYVRYLEDLLTLFSPLERLLLYGFTIILGLSMAVFVATINDRISTLIPARGGTITEGETVPARFVNPILAVSQADQDLSMLIYSGLMRAQADGTFIPDLAERFTISPDGTTYTFAIRTDATFHDGTPVTAADILYTVSLAQNPDIKSPRRADWEGVQVSSPDDHTVIFTLPHAYAPFMENTTLGILPKHLWQDVPTAQFAFSALNTHPIGSGPFKIAKTQTDSTGAATRFELVPFGNFTLGAPHLARINFVFFTSEDQMVRAYEARQIDSMASISPTQLVNLSRTVALVRAPLPRVFGVFLNETRNPVLADAHVREALDAAIDKTAIVKNALGGFGIPLNGPLPPGVAGPFAAAVPALFSPDGTSTAVADPTLIARAKQILADGGWTYDENAGTWTKNKQVLAFKLATAETSELASTAQAVAAAWRAVGFQVDVQVYSLSEFNNTVLRPREYDAILFGEVVGRDADLFAFWHSSQRNDPGLNLALYANSKADALLAQARAASDKRQRDALYATFVDLIREDRPAVFLYSPEFLYILPREVQGVRIGTLTTPAERFLEVYQWYTDTQRVWNFFAQ